MATYKVPQDVEADDHLIGPFSLRQFIYLVIVVMAIAIGWGLAQLFIPLAIIPLPVVLLFGALALPLRKDQPMETYMAAMVSFFLKPHKRLWDPDGIDTLIEITAPKIADIQRTKDITQTEAERRIGYLAQIVDTQGWAVRGTGTQSPNSAMISDVYFESQQAQDVMDINNSTAQALNQKLDQSDARRHQAAVNLMQGQTATYNYFNSTAPTEPITAPTQTETQHLDYDPYPEEMRQTMVMPTAPAQKPIIGPAIPNAKPAQTTSVKPLPAGIINLASNNNLSIDTIAREANRINKKQDMTEEVVISLR
jgi:hypothetical protein